MRLPNNGRQAIAFFDHAVAIRLLLRLTWREEPGLVFANGVPYSFYVGVRLLPGDEIIPLQGVAHRTIDDLSMRSIKSPGVVATSW